MPVAEGISRRTEPEKLVGVEIRRPLVIFEDTDS